MKANGGRVNLRLRWHLRLPSPEARRTTADALPGVETVRPTFASTGTVEASTFLVLLRQRVGPPLYDGQMGRQFLIDPGSKKTKQINHLGFATWRRG